VSISADSFNVARTGMHERRALPGRRHFSMERRVRNASRTGSAVGARSGGWTSGWIRPGAVAQYFRQLAKESEHGNETQESCEETRQEEGWQEEEKGCQTQSGSQEETGEEEEKGGQEGRQEKSCEETRQEESQATDEDGQTCGETSGACPDGGSCCTVDGGRPWGKDCPESRCCLAVPDRVSALGGGRIVCGRALCKQSPVRRHSALEVACPPRLSPRKTRVFYQSPGGEAGAVLAQNFFIVRRSTSA